VTLESTSGKWMSFLSAAMSALVFRSAGSACGCFDGGGVLCAVTEAYDIVECSEESTRRG
jgi:hypothetical protein